MGKEVGDPENLLKIKIAMFRKSSLIEGLLDLLHALKSFKAMLAKHTTIRSIVFLFNSLLGVPSTIQDRSSYESIAP